MSLMVNSFCKLCDMNFLTEEEFSLHSCIEIKQENHDLKVQQNFKIFDNSDLDLSEEFLAMILKQVDVLCYIINNGDPNIKRTVKVIQVLNNAINCYKNKVNEEDIIENKEYFDQDVELSGSENESNEYGDKDTDYAPPKELLKRKPMKRKNNDNTNIKRTVFNTEVTTKSESHEEIDRIKLYPYLKYDIAKNMFECAFCPQITSGRQHLLKHLNRFHVSEIKSEIEENGVQNTEPKYDCVIRKCRLMYGRQHQLWCKMCSETNVHNSTSNVAKENQENSFLPLKNEDLLRVNFNSEMENNSTLYEEVSNDQSMLAENVDNETAIQVKLVT